ncbi:hypothetical protein CLU79DRAFT_679065, partial [Phycomyces nitens]
VDWEEADPYHLQMLTRLGLYRKKQDSEQKKKSNDKGLDDEMEETALETNQK